MLYLVNKDIALVSAFPEMFDSISKTLNINNIRTSKLFHVTNLYSTSKIP